MKILTVLGTRPEIIRLSIIMPLLDKYCDHVIVYTNQNYDKNLKDIFFQQLQLRAPDYVLDCATATSPMEQISKIFCGCESILKKEKPDRALILGDTNSGLCAFVAKRMGIPVYHMEAGNRCFDNRVPEEVNRRVIDHSSTILMPYTERSRDNLLAEGIESRRIYVTGNPIKEVIENYIPIDSECSTILNLYGVKSKEYFLVTLHREENVDDPSRLQTFLNSLNEVQKRYNYPMLFSVHPRTKKRLEALDLLENSSIMFMDPLPFLYFVKLELSAFCILSDSGTVQEEACIYKIPCVTLRDTTERPETLECGSNIITGCDMDKIVNAVNIVTSPFRKSWSAPEEYLKDNVSETVLKILLS
jgi:UDP-N-acetylglucosamine 2-epimerase (non-hydrolysing)